MSPGTPLRRIMVVGNGGSGKSTVATRLGELLDLPVVHLDAGYWQPGWVPAATDEWRARCEELAGADRWVMDGNYGGSYPTRVPRADLIVLLDLPRRVTITAALARWLRWRGRTRPSMGAGCPERMSGEFLVWMWRYPKNGRATVLGAVAAAGAEQRLVRLTSRRAVNRWLTGFMP